MSPPSFPPSIAPYASTRLPFIPPSLPPSCFASLPSSFLLSRLWSVLVLEPSDGCDGCNVCRSVPDGFTWKVTRNERRGGQGCISSTLVRSLLSAPLGLFILILFYEHEYCDFVYDSLPLVPRVDRKDRKGAEGDIRDTACFTRHFFTATIIHLSP